MTVHLTFLDYLGLYMDGVLASVVGPLLMMVMLALLIGGLSLVFLILGALPRAMADSARWAVRRARQARA